METARKSAFLIASSSIGTSKREKGSGRAKPANELRRSSPSPSAGDAPGSSGEVRPKWSHAGSGKRSALPVAHVLRPPPRTAVRQAQRGVQARVENALRFTAITSKIEREGLRHVILTDDFYDQRPNAARRRPSLRQGRDPRRRDFLLGSPSPLPRQCRRSRPCAPQGRGPRQSRRLKGPEAGGKRRSVHNRRSGSKDDRPPLCAAIARAFRRPVNRIDSSKRTRSARTFAI